MRKYLELFKEGFPSDMSDRTAIENWPYIGYDVVNDLVKFSTIPSQEETVGIPGYVDLGLSVMWAECNLGADSQEQLGDTYQWVGKETSGGEDHTYSLDPLKDPVYINNESKYKEIFHPRVATLSNVIELLDNTTKTSETINSVQGYRFTAANGNSIFIPESQYWTPITSISSTYVSANATTWNPNEGMLNNSTSKTTFLPYRGVCNILPKDNAIILQKNTPIQVKAEQLYCFPKTWKGVYITLSSKDPVQMYTSPSYDFGIAQSNGAWRRVFTFDLEGDHRAIYASDSEMQLITDKAIDDYIYARFVGDITGTIEICDWQQSTCVSKSTLIRPNASFAVLARSSSKIYRLKYSDWNGYDITIKWGGSVTLPVYIADRCEFTLSPSNASVLQYASISRKSSFKIAASAVDNWASRVGEDGYIYVRFNPTNQGSVTFVTEKPQE